MRLRYRLIGAIVAIVVTVAAVGFMRYVRDGEAAKFDNEVEHFKYGSIGAEVNGYPYVVWQTLPKLFPERAPKGWATFGFSYESGKPLPVGVSVRKYGIPRVGFNCATCHTSTVNESPEIILGAPSNKLDTEAYLRFIVETSTDPRFTADAIFAEASRSGDGVGWLDRIVYRYFVIPKLKTTLEQVAAANRWRALRPAHGPGRTDAGNPWRLHFQMHPEADGLVGTVDFPSLWNQQIRQGSWMHWDGNNNSLQERNLSAALAGGATEDSLDHSSIERVAAWSLVAPAPPYPFEIDTTLARKGQEIYQARCASCHAPGGASYGEATPIGEVGTDSQRLDLFTDELLKNFSTVGKNRPWQFRHYRKSDGYANQPLDGIWARAPYLHNGSVPTLFDLLASPAERPTQFFRGCDTFDPEKVGFACGFGALFDTRERGNGNGGHLYGTDLPLDQRLALIEYLKTQ